MLKSALLLAIALLTVTLIACGDDDDDAPQPASTSFPEGSLRIEIESLDTGLLKGHAYADAEDGWIVSEFSVTARDDSGIGWQVIEPDVSGVGGTSVTEFFEVVIQELPRGDQVAVEAVATFQDESGATVEQTVVDNWPP